MIGAMVNWLAAARVAARRTARRLRRWRDATRERRLVARAGTAAGLTVVALVGMSVGLLLGGRVHQDVGPFAVQFVMRPSLSGGTSVLIPPLGSLDVRSHDGPVHVEVTLDSVDRQRAEALVNSPNGI